MKKIRPRNYSIWKKGILSLASLMLFVSFQIIPFLKSKEDRAKVHHYKAIKMSQEGKTKKAIKELNKAILLDRENEYYVDLANLHAKNSDIKKAYNAVSKVSLEDGSSPISKVELQAWKAYYALSLGLPRKPFSAFNNAVDLMQLYKIDSNQLMSNLYNNCAVSRLFDQSEPSKGEKPKVHFIDFRQAKRKLVKALKYNPDNCVAKYNLDFVNTVLEVPQDSMGTIKYLVDSLYNWRTFPELNCIIPPPPPHDEILVTLNKEKEVVFILDISGSKGAPATNGVTRFQAMKDLVLSLLNDLDEAVDIGLITLGQNHSYQRSGLSFSPETRGFTRRTISGFSATGFGVGLCAEVITRNHSKIKVKNLT